MELLSPRRLKIANWVVLAILVAVGYLVSGREFALGVLVGGLLVVVNFHLLHRFLKGTLEKAQVDPESKGRTQAFFAAKQLLRFTGLVAVVFLLVRHGWVNVIGLVVGLSTVALTLTLLGLNEAMKIKNKEANPSHGTSHPLS
ncbi:MAG: ATP synthase subunit I [Deltaproteobacteria bacterium]|nr:ATP synthase subunit I [Deltaproteobacteria bacterium]